MANPHQADSLNGTDTPISTMSSSTASTLLPAGHPEVPAHIHTNGQCPVTGHKSHEYCPPQDGDLRSVCPALNTMANHGYIPRDGQNLTFGVLFRGLKECYGLSSPLATVLVTGGFLLIHRSPLRVPYLSDLSLFSAKNPDGTVSPGGVIDLHLIGLHNGVEHDASLVHTNADGAKYAPVEIQDEWVPDLVGDILPPVQGSEPARIPHPHRSLSDSTTSSTSSDGSLSTGSSFYASAYSVPSLRKYISDPAYLDVLVNEDDVGRMRARRQKEILPDKLSAKHAEIARGEMAIILGVWRQERKEKGGIPLPWLLQWLSEERLPEVPAPMQGTDSKTPATVMWRPSHKQSLLDVVKRSSMIREVTNEIEKGKSKSFLTRLEEWIPFLRSKPQPPTGGNGGQ
ncbi:hypothetical protein GYMLUDRAFT_50435 [Collybiopsis luxurians FD-317 M1]|uniref:Heme haloperoxidase family profile domain-containing protein n=1 Tax=Collybiopsis luxurians FD-317 M1 TaxID=944289 RepID=A0A0D0C9Y9_9AGAR|nr:hypothetical protein GYMLUDRAFT_50435 [Collybiopsis luxurians FD-317 M1]